MQIYLPVITLNVNVNVPISNIGWLNKYNSKTHLYAGYKRLTRIERHTQTEGEVMGEDIPNK